MTLPGFTLLLSLFLLLGCGPGIDSPNGDRDSSNGGPDLALDLASPDGKPDGKKDIKPDLPKPDLKKPDIGPKPDIDKTKCEQIDAAAGAHVAAGRAHNCAGMVSTCIPGEVNTVINGLCACANGSNEIIGIAASPAKVTVHWFNGAKPLWHFYGPCPKP